MIKQLFLLSALLAAVPVCGASDRGSLRVEMHKDGKSLYDETGPITADEGYAYVCFLEKRKPGEGYVSAEVQAFAVEQGIQANIHERRCDVGKNPQVQVKGGFVEVSHGGSKNITGQMFTDLTIKLTHIPGQSSTQ